MVVHRAIQLQDSQTLPRPDRLRTFVTLLHRFVILPPIPPPGPPAKEGTPSIRATARPASLTFAVTPIRVS